MDWSSDNICFHSSIGCYSNDCIYYLLAINFIFTND